LNPNQTWPTGGGADGNPADIQRVRRTARQGADEMMRRYTLIATDRFRLPSVARSTSPMLPAPICAVREVWPQAFDERNLWDVRRECHFECHCTGRIGKQKPTNGSRRKNPKTPIR
jgi:hypothetical protein